MFPRAIVVLGAPRSGTTVLKRYLASNPGCSSTPFPKQLSDVTTFNCDGVAVWKKTKWIDPAVLPNVVGALGVFAYYVVVARYPTSAYRSLIELNAFRGATTHEWLPGSCFDEYLKWWSQAYRDARQLLPEDRQLLVSYEAFVLSPADIRKQILAAVGLIGVYGTWYNNSEPLAPTLEDEKCISRSHVHAEGVLRVEFTPEASRAYDDVFGEQASERLKTRLESERPRVNPQLSIVIEDSTRRLTGRTRFAETIARAHAAAVDSNQSFELIVAGPEAPPVVKGAAVRWIRSTDGYYQQKNAGAAAARGEFVIFWDSDCRAEAGYLGHAIATLQCDPSLSGIAGITFYDGDGWLTRVNTALSFGYLLAGILESPRFPPLAHNIVIRRSLFPNPPFGPFTARSGGDAHLGATAAGCGRPILLDQKLVIRHEDCSYSPVALIERHLREHFNHHARSLCGAKLLLRVWRSVLQSATFRRRKVRDYGQYVGIDPTVWTTILCWAYALLDAAAVAWLTVCPPLLRKWLRYQYGEAVSIVTSDRRYS